MGRRKVIRVLAFPLAALLYYFGVRNVENGLIGKGASEIAVATIGFVIHWRRLRGNGR